MSAVDPTIIYFGGEPIGVPVLQELQACNLTPKLIVCSPDRPVGRKQVITPPPVKTWADRHNIPTWQPETYRGQEAQAAAKSILTPYLNQPYLIFVVVAYNFILPQWLLNLSPRGIINVHPSLLPKLRGASPIRTAIKYDLRDQIGVSIMLLDKKMDHGPILQQIPMPISDENWPVSGPKLDSALAHLGGALLAETIVRYLSGDITPTEQDHKQATYCGRFDKADSEISFDPAEPPQGDAARTAWRNIQAWEGIGGTFFISNNTRIKINNAKLIQTDEGVDELCLLSVTPAGKKEQSYQDWYATWRTNEGIRNGV